MKAWGKALKTCADPARARHFYELLAATAAGPELASFGQEQGRILASLFSGSQALGSLLVAHPDWLGAVSAEALKFPRRKQGLRGELERLTTPLLESQDYASALRHIREFKNRETLRIAARDLARLGQVAEITREISDLADVCLNAVWEICHSQLTNRFGQPFHQDPNGQWHPTAGCVLGMGKLGGQELNYSSDVDLLLAYSDEGAVFREAPTGRKARQPALSNHQFFNRLAEAFIAEMTRMSPEGSLYRIDLRLRPEGESGPLSRALAGYENYYAQWGQTWERMMLIKARPVAGDEGLGTEFLEMIQPFRYPRSISPGVLREVAAMKDRIEHEVVKSGELDRNVKLGRGGIREIEFIAQSRQLLYAGRQPFLQGAQTLPCLEKLVQYELLEQGDSRVLTEAYCFLRDVEHRLQMDDNRQTHTIPDDRKVQERLARLMGFAGALKFETALKQHTAGVRAIFEKLLKGASPEPAPASDFPRQFEGAAEAWKQVLLQHRFRDLDKGIKVLREFVEGPGYVHVSPRTTELAFGLLGRLLALCPQTPAGPLPQVWEALDAAAGSASASPAPRPPLSDPDRVLTRLDSFIAAYGARSTLFELWNSNPMIFELLVLLFDRSEFLAELAIRTLDLVDELVTSGRLRQRKNAEETLRDLRHGLQDQDQHLWLRRYHQAELMRIGLRDILGLADPEQYLAELSALAEACLQYALEVVTRKNRLKAPPFAVIGLGKLGGREIDYGSDLDILFVADDAKAKNLVKLKEVALQLMDLLSTRTGQGIVFHTDARLRPDGEKGLLVNTIKAYEEYYRQRAQLWEIQSLSRARFVGGDARLGARFQDLSAVLTNFSKPSLPLAAYSRDWPAKIHAMRVRIQNERTPRGQGALAIKTGSGGLMDAEFIAQTLCLQHGWYEPNTQAALQRGRDCGVLPQADKLISNYRKLRRIEGVLRRWSYEGETVLPDDPAPYYRVSVRCGFSTPEAFAEFLAGCRRAIREVYEQVLHS